MNTFGTHLLSAMQQLNFARAYALVRMRCKKPILAFLITLACVILLSPMGKAAGGSPTVLTGPAVLDDWGNRFISFGQMVRENALRTQVRTTIAQLAMFDAVNGVLDGAYRPFASRPESAPGASLEAREGDHRNEPELVGYTPGSGPGVWIPTSSANPQTPFLQFVRPFGYDDPMRFRPHAPPALDSRTYTIDYNEIKDLGRDTETSRTPEQSATALFWSPSASALWTANVRSRAGSLDLLNAARFEAIGVAAVTNGLIASWDVKYTYMFWRPVTAIRFGDTDGNSETEPDPAWTPFIVTPSHPEYPSAHTTVGAAALGFYTVWFGTDQFRFPFAFKGNGNAVRYYNSVSEIRAEEGNARVWGGMHWRNSVEVGAAVGSRVGKYTATHLLKPLDD